MGARVGWGLGWCGDQGGVGAKVVCVRACMCACVCVRVRARACVKACVHACGGKLIIKSK